MRRTPRPSRRSFRNRNSNLRFKFWLAGRLGKTVGEIQQQMSPREYGYWKVLSRVEEQERAELRAMQDQLASTAAAMSSK